MRTGKANKYMLDFALRHRLRFRHAFLDGFHSRLEVYDGTALQSLGFRNTKTDGLDPGRTFSGDQCADFCRPDVEAYNDFFSVSHTTFCSSGASTFVRRIAWFLNRKST